MCTNILRHTPMRLALQTNLNHPMKTRILLAITASFLITTAPAQRRPTQKALPRPKATLETPVSQLPEYSLSRGDMEAQLRFLASDELLGRRTGEPGNRVAARYIAEEFRRLGLKIGRAHV